MPQRPPPQLRLQPLQVRAPASPAEPPVLSRGDATRPTEVSANGEPRNTEADYSPVEDSDDGALATNDGTCADIAPQEQQEGLQHQLQAEQRPHQGAEGAAGDAPPGEGLAPEADLVPQGICGTLSLFWPTISAFVVRRLAASAEPILQASLPKNVVADLRFDIDRCRLGDEPLSFKHITGSRDRVVLTGGYGSRRGRAGGTGADSAAGAAKLTTFSLELAQDSPIILKFHRTRLGVDSVVIKGSVRVEGLCPCGGPPLPHSLSIYFIDVPEVCLDWPGTVVVANNELRCQIVDLVSAVVASFMVLPNSFAFALAPPHCADALEAKASLLQGVLTLHLREAEHVPHIAAQVGSQPGQPLPPQSQQPQQTLPWERDCVERECPRRCMERNSCMPEVLAGCLGPGATTQDGWHLRRAPPPVRMRTRFDLRCGSQRRTQETHPRSLGAYNATFLISDPARERVFIELHTPSDDFLMPLSSTLLGTESLGASDMIAWGCTEMAVDLASDEFGGMAAGGRVRLSAMWRPLRPLPANPRRGLTACPTDACLLLVGVYGVRLLPRLGSSVLHWIVADCDQIAWSDSGRDVRSSPKVAERCEAPDGMSLTACNQVLRRRLAVLQRLGVTPEGCARALAEAAGSSGDEPLGESVTPATAVPVEQRVLRSSDEAQAAAGGDAAPSDDAAFTPGGAGAEAAAVGAAEDQAQAQGQGGPDGPSHSRANLQELKFDHLFGFAVAQPLRARLTLKLMHRVPQARKDRMTDTFHLNVADLLRPGGSPDGSSGGGGLQPNSSRGTVGLLLQSPSLPATGCVLDLRLQLLSIARPDAYMVQI